ncbi:tyrosine-type recombinase/integrase [Hyphococcus sp. DH-69]|uniref:tyrosine-type recombinase/integrase n=1 Tax=Hyphococcus formosus TaxID=3143534 RepID=UPI00398B9C6B
MALTDIQIRRLKPESKPFRRSDGGGLYIEVKPTGSKLWRMAYRFDGKQKLLAFGAYPDVSLALARSKRHDAKALLAEAIDPAAHAKAEKEEQIALTEHTFGKIADELIEKGEKEGLAERTLEKKRWLLSLAMPDLGDLPITAITAPQILATLRKVEAKGNYETAKRMRSVIGQVFRFAISTTRASNDPTFGLRGALTTPKTVHMAAFTEWEDYAGLIRAIWGYQSGAPETRTALKLMALLYTRPGELRLAKWDEFDLDARKWTIPAERMKMRRKHIKPLPTQAVELLRELREINFDTELVFPSTLRNGKPISENTMNTALRRMGFTQDECTSHGFRASASSLLNESGKWSPDAIEAELAHRGSDEVRRAYHRSSYWDERVKMCQWWADRLLAVT